MTQQQMVDEWDDEQEPDEPQDAHHADASIQQYHARRQQLLSKLQRDVQQQRQAPATYGRSSGGSFEQGAMVPVRHAPLTEYQIPVQYIPVQQPQQRDWIALAIPGMMCFSALTLGGMAIMAGNQPREHDAYMMAKLAEATKAVAERPASNYICITVAGVCPGAGNTQPAQPPTTFAAADYSQPFSFQQYLDRLNQHYSAGQVSEEMHRGFDQWVNHFRSNPAEFTTALNSLSKPQCDAEPLKCAAISWVHQEKNAAFTQVPQPPVMQQ